MSLFFMLNPKASGEAAVEPGGHFIPGSGEPQVIPTESEVKARLEKVLPKELVQELGPEPETAIEKKVEEFVDNSPSFADIKAKASGSNSGQLTNIIGDLERQIDDFSVLAEQERLVKEVLRGDLEELIADTHSRVLALELEFLKELSIQREDEELFLLLIQTEY